MSLIDYRRNNDVVIKNKNKLAWNICNKHSININNIVNKNNKSLLVENIYKKYLLELKSNNLNITNKKKYINCWITLINTINNNKNSDKIKRNALIQLNYVSEINN